MSLKNVFLAGLATLALLGWEGARAQGPAGPYGDAPAPQGGDGAAVPPGTYRGPACLSPWLVYACEDCCGALDDHNPMRTELYLRVGGTVPYGDGVLADSIDSGFAIQGGGRGLFFNRRGDAAWTIDLGLTNLNNPADSGAATVTLFNLPFQSAGVLGTGQTIPEPVISAQIGALNRTYVNLGGGREWYLLGGACGTRDTPEPAFWRIGIDAGGRWGTSKLQLRNIDAVGETQPVTPVKRHLTDTIGAVYVALHSDVDIPCGCCVFQAGFRTEWDYTWSDILQIQNDSDVMSVNLLFNVGVRY